MNIKIDISNVVLKTNILILRPWSLENLDDRVKTAFEKILNTYQNEKNC